jgi:hypothetical protein
MKLISEITEDVGVTSELNEETGKKSFFIEGIFMQGNLKNRNGRVYKTETLEKEMGRYQTQFIDTKRALGELGHPDGPQINGDRVSHLITSMQREGDNFMGRAKILGTPMGEIVKTFLEEGVRCGVSTRGLGSVKQKNGVMEVQDDFHLATVDIVTDPSAPNAFVNGIMENTEFYYDVASSNWIAQQPVEEVIEEIQEAVEKQYRTVYKRIDESTAARMFETFISSLRK